MKENLGGLVVVVLLFGVPILWGVLRDRVGNDSVIGKVMGGVGKGVEIAVDGGHWVIQKALGLGLVVLVALGVVYLGQDWRLVLGEVVALMYGVYLLWPGSRSFWIIG